MKIDWNKKYTTISVYAFLVICASIIFFSIIGEIDAFTTKLGWVVSTLQPFIIGFVMAYLFNFILVFYEEKVLVFDLVKNLKKKSKRGISIVLTYLTVFFIIALFMQFVLPQLVDSIVGLVNDVPTYVSNATKLIEELTRNLDANNEYVGMAMEKWNEIVSLLKTESPLIAGVLNDSKAYIKGEFLLIDAPNSQFRSLINSTTGNYKDSIRKAAFKVLGATYKLGPYQKNQNNTDENDPLKALEAKLKNLEIN